MRNTVDTLKILAVAIAVVILVGSIAVLSAQQLGAQQQQRPRRVGEATPSPSPLSPSPPDVGTGKGAKDGGEQVGDDDVVRVETQLVSVPAVVLDASGRPLTNLKAENFTIYESNSPQKISNFATTETPFEVALLLDTSGSTREDVMLIKNAAKAFIAALRPGDRVSVIAFNTQKLNMTSLATVDVQSKLTSDRDVLKDAVERIGSSNGTPYYDSLERIADDVFHDPPTGDFKGRRALVALTDGVDSSSNAEFAVVKRKLERSQVACYFIEVNTEEFVEDRLLKDCRDDGTLRLSHAQMLRYRQIYAPRTDADDYQDFCKLGQFQRMDISRSLYNLARKEMADLAKVSGGKTFQAAALSDASAAFEQVARDIGTQYSLGYYPTNKARDGQFREIRVVLKGVTGQVRARPGYYAPKG